MAFWLCDTVGTGSDDLEDAIRPAVALYTDDWTVIANAPGSMLVRCEHQPQFDADVRIRRLRRELLRDLAPDDGETDESLHLVAKVARRFLLHQVLGADDFGTGALSRTLSEIPAARRSRIRERLLARGYDISAINAGTTVEQALRHLLPQFHVRVSPKQQAPSGTFTDSYAGESGDVDLASHTPSGGTAWERVDGSANMALVNSSAELENNTSDTSGAFYRCDDQGSADQYVQYTVIATSLQGPYHVNRTTDRLNFIGIRSYTSKLQIFKVEAGSFTQLGSTSSTGVSSGDVLRLESNGNAHEGFINGVSAVGPANSTFQNTATRQGIIARSSGASRWASSFEAGLLGAGAVTVDCLPGAMTPAGQSATLAEIVPAAAGGFTPGGATAALSIGIPAAVGEIAPAGANASLTETLTGGIGALLPAGAACSLSESVPGQIGALSPAGVGAAVTLTIPAQTATVLPAGAVAVLTEILPAGVGGITPSGVAAALVEIVPVSIGAVTPAGLSAGIGTENVFTVECDIGAALPAGLAAVLTEQLQAAVGALSVEGVTAAVVEVIPGGLGVLTPAASAAQVAEAVAAAVGAVVPAGALANISGGIVLGARGSRSSPVEVRPKQTVTSTRPASVGTRRTRVTH